MSTFSSLPTVCERRSARCALRLPPPPFYSWSFAAFTPPSNPPPSIEHPESCIDSTTIGAADSHSSVRWVPLDLTCNQGVSVAFNALPETGARQRDVLARHLPPHPAWRSRLQQKTNNLSNRFFVCNKMFEKRKNPPGYFVGRGSCSCDTRKCLTSIVRRQKVVLSPFRARREGRGGAGGRGRRVSGCVGGWVGTGL